MSWCRLQFGGLRLWYGNSDARFELRRRLRWWRVVAFHMSRPKCRVTLGPAMPLTQTTVLSRIPSSIRPNAWPYIGPFYPYPQVPLGWRRSVWNGTTAGGSLTSNRSSGNDIWPQTEKPAETAGFFAPPDGLRQQLNEIRLISSVILKIHKSVPEFNSILVPTRLRDPMDTPTTEEHSQGLAMKTQAPFLLLLIVSDVLAYRLCGHVGQQPGVLSVPIRITPYWQKALEDRNWEHERYERVPIMGPVTSGGPPLALDAPSDDEVMRRSSQSLRWKVASRCFGNASETTSASSRT